MGNKHSVELSCVKSGIFKIIADDSGLSAPTPTRELCVCSYQDAKKVLPRQDWRKLSRNLEFSCAKCGRPEELFTRELRSFLGTFGIPQPEDCVAAAPRWAGRVGRSYFSDSSR